MARTADEYCRTVKLMSKILGVLAAEVEVQFPNLQKGGDNIAIILLSKQVREVQSLERLA